MGWPEVKQGEQKTILDLMSKDELKQQLTQQTEILVQSENRSARLERLLGMALHLKRTYRERITVLEERIEIRDVLIEELRGDADVK